MKVLFLCTGNYYRSRFAEELFNHLSLMSGSPWRADSRGLAASFPRPRNPGTISIHVIETLRSLGLEALEPDREPARVQSEDLESAALVVALSETEHRPLLAQAFPEWLDRIEWWEVGDIPLETVSAALTKIEEQVRTLRERLAC
jgi:protein-tyrosine phosphatase